MRTAKWVTVFLTATSLGSLRLPAQTPDTPPPTPPQEQPEVLSRGPVHEAFAEPVTMELQTGVIAPQQPPANINEIPPEERPQGAQFVWIPGYWAWDADRNSYIWVSACWRAAPPKMSWVPGYWARVPDGWEWISGYWAPAGVQNIEYLPAPPVVEDLEPVIIQPSPDMIWVPPCMYWHHGQYIRRNGYWLRAQQNWIWVPAHYVMTPRGYIFAEGHWDYSLDRRGVLFAPVYFPPAVYGRVSFTFTPGIVIDTGLLRVSLFAYPRYCHYYFGDYYDDVYVRIGIFPWFESRHRHTWYDPIYEHDRWHHRSEPRWEDHKRDEYRRRHDNRDLRPPHTFREQESRLSRLPEPQRHAQQVARPLETAIARKTTPMKFERIDNDARQKISKQANEVRTFRDERTHWESPSTGGSKTSRPGGERKPTVTPATERKQPGQPTGELKPTVQPTQERKTTIPPTTERKPTERKPTVQPTQERKPAVMPTTERKPTVQPSQERKPFVMPEPERRPTVQPTVERKPAVMPATERGQIIQPAVERKPTVMPEPELKPTLQPTVDRQPSVMPTTGSRQSVQPAIERRPTVTQGTELRQTPQPARKSVNTVPLQGSQREPNPFRETQTRQPERIQIPVSPVTGNSGRQGIFNRGPPTQPSAERRGHTDADR